MLNIHMEMLRDGMDANVGYISSPLTNEYKHSAVVKNVWNCKQRENGNQLITVTINNKKHKKFENYIFYLVLI